LGSSTAEIDNPQHTCHRITHEKTLYGSMIPAMEWQKYNMV